MKSFIAKPHEVERKWYVIDAEGQTLGRLASEVASILRGKKDVYKRQMYAISKIVYRYKCPQVFIDYYFPYNYNNSMRDWRIH